MHPVHYTSDLCLTHGAFWCLQSIITFETTPPFFTYDTIEEKRLGFLGFVADSTFLHCVEKKTVESLYVFYA